MRYEFGESYEHWLNRVQQHEYDLALSELANGMPIDIVLERMATRIVQKGLHPILKALQSMPNNYDAEKSRAAYEEHYINARKGPPPADHVTED
jgi:glutamyl-tRNA reductase